MNSNETTPNTLLPCLCDYQICNEDQPMCSTNSGKCSPSKQSPVCSNLDGQEANSVLPCACTTDTTYINRYCDHSVPYCNASILNNECTAVKSVKNCSDQNGQTKNAT